MFRAGLQAVRLSVHPAIDSTFKMWQNSLLQRQFIIP